MIARLIILSSHFSALLTLAIAFPVEKQACGPGKQNAECGMEKKKQRMPNLVGVGKKIG
jgi:hypothetical protein